MHRLLFSPHETHVYQLPHLDHHSSQSLTSSIDDCKTIPSPRLHAFRVGEAPRGRSGGPLDSRTAGPGRGRGVNRTDRA